MSFFKYLKVILVIIALVLSINNFSFAQTPYLQPVKKTLINNGIDLEITYKGEFWSLFNSNQKILDGYLDNFDFITTLDLEKLIGSNSTVFSIYFLGNNGFKPNEYLKSRHGVSNIAAPNAWKIYTCYLEKSFLNDKISLLLGLYDYNSEFDSKETASIFLNPSHGIGTDIAQTGKNGPSIFPTASLGFRLKSKITDEMYMLATILDGVPGNPNNPKGTFVILNKNDGYFVSMESGFTNSIQDSIQDFKFAGGFWYYTDNFNHLFSNITNWGFYAFFDKMIYKSKSSPFKISGYGRIGYADILANSINFFIAGGIVFDAIIPSRENDKLGIAIASAYDLDDDYRTLDKPRFENNIEITYIINITNYLFAQPNFQYISCPIEHDLTENFFAIGLRLTVNIF